MTIERREYSREEIARNDGSNGSRVWIIVHAIVYDVTDYMDSHPGGSELITEYAGTDATEGFDDFGHSSDAKRLLKKYEIGTVIDSKDELIQRKNYANNDAVRAAKRQQTRRRRKFLSTILGPCANR